MILDTTRPHCTVRLSGGLGNQLFQYAAGRSLSLRTQSRLRLDTSFYWRARRRARALELPQFPIAAEIEPIPHRFPRLHRAKAAYRRTREIKATYREPSLRFEPSFLSLRAPVVLEGYFQSERYFLEFADQIRAELAIPAPLDQASLETGRRIRETQATALHLRRGDYVSDPRAQARYASCPLSYYHQAMERVPGCGPVFVFSDDLDWAQQNLRPIKPLVFPDRSAPRSGLTDFWLMSQAQHHIIANSTFSWWAAWLGRSERGITIAPARWFNDPQFDDTDLVPRDWIRL